MKRVVLDTNTLISGLLWDGNESMVIEKAEKKEIKLFISHQMLEELEGVLKRKKFSLSSLSFSRYCSEIFSKIP